MSRIGFASNNLTAGIDRLIETASETPQIGVPKTLFQTTVRHSIPVEAYDVDRLGRFLMVSSVAESTAPVVLVTDWDAALGK